MAITIGNFTTASSTTSVNTLNVAVPSGGESGDVYVVFASGDVDGAMSGFTNKITQTSTSYQKHYVFVKDYTGSEGANFTFTTSAFDPTMLICVIVKGSTGISGITSQNSAITTDSFVSANITKAVTSGNITTTDGQFVLACMGSHGPAGTSGTSTITAFSGFSSIGSVTLSNALAILSLYYKTETTGGTTNYSGTIAWNAGGNYEGVGSALVFSVRAPIVFKQYANGAFQAARFVEGDF